MFTDNEIAYLQSGHLARVATVSENGQPDVVPVGFEFDGTYFYVGGRNNEATRKGRNVAAGNPKVALVIDDLESVEPWAPRGIRIYGKADIVERQGYAGPGNYLRIKPALSWSWNVEKPGMVDGRPVRHRTVHE